MERTFAIIKPDAVEKNAIGPILSRIAEGDGAESGMQAASSVAGTPSDQ